MRTGSPRTTYVGATFVLGRCAVEQPAAQGLVLRAQNADLLGQVTVTLHGRSNFGASDSTDAELTVGVDGSPAVWIRRSPIIVGNDAFRETNRAEMVVRRLANRRVSRDHRCHQRREPTWWSPPH